MLRERGGTKPTDPHPALSYFPVRKGEEAVPQRPSAEAHHVLGLVTRYGHAAHEK
jgi:hypothetical protein